MTRVAWTDDDLEQALEMRAANMSFEDIAARLGRTWKSVNAAVARYNTENRANHIDYEYKRYQDDARTGSAMLRRAIQSAGLSA